MKLLAPALLCLALLASGCRDDAGPADARSTATSTATSAIPPTATPSHAARITDPRSIVSSDDAHLGFASIRMVAGRRVVSTWWARQGSPGAVATSSDGFAVTRFDRSTPRLYARLVDSPSRDQAPVTGPLTRGLMRQQITSLRPGVSATYAGGDGATLFPFQVTARRTGAGAWQEFPVARIDGARAYVSGGFVLADGRLLVLLDHWSSDRGGERPGPQHHGLWVSRGEDWSHYRPVHARLWPPTTAQITSLGTAPSGPAWVTTNDDRLFVAAPGSLSFRQIAARPDDPGLHPPTGAQIVDAADARLVDARAQRADDGELTWQALWRAHGRLATTANTQMTPQATSWAAWARQDPPTAPPPAPEPDLRRMNRIAAVDLTGFGTAQVIAPPVDGVPFTSAARMNHVAEWTTYRVTGAAAGQEVSGQVELPDGRLLVLLGSPPASSGRLWVSAGDDWSRYRPFASASLRRGVNGLDADPSGVVWAWTTTRLFVSTDGARSFSRVPARPGRAGR